MKPIYILAPYWMGDFSPPRASIARHTWRLVAPPIEAEDAENAPTEPTERMGILCAGLADHVAEVRENGNLPIGIVGDCTFSIGMVAGLQRTLPDLTLVWFDAHGDFNTHDTTPSGFIGGMPLAMLCGRGEQTILEKAGADALPETDVILTDARDLDPEEGDAVAASDITHIDDAARLLALHLPEDKPIYVHFDTDILDAKDLPATDYATANGPTLETIEMVLAYLARTGRVVGLSVTMWNPDLDDEDHTAEATIMELVEAFVTRLTPQ